MNDSSTPRVRFDLSVDRARERLIDRLMPLRSQTHPILAALGCVLDRDVIAPVDLPAYSNSAMDGFALHSASASHASPQQPVHLRIAGMIEAGGRWIGSLRPGETIRINTGAAIPAGCDTIVATETIEVHETHIQIDRPIEPGRHIRLAGEDIRKGTTAIVRGTVLGSREIGLLAALGLETIEIIPAPRIGILSTGPELSEYSTPAPIYDVNGPMLASAIREVGGIVTRIAQTDGTIEHLHSFIEAESRVADLIIITGGISNSPADTVAALLASEPSGELWQVRLRPGKHFGIGRFGHTTVLALPGNPVAAYVGFELFARPAIDWLAGKSSGRYTTSALLSASVFGTDDRTDAIRGFAHVNENGAIMVAPAGNRGSGVVSSLTESNCLIILPENVTDRHAGDLVSIQWFDHR